MPHVAWANLSVAGSFPVWTVPALVFGTALAVALRAAAWFTRLLEDLGDHWDLSPGLLSFISALGANVPNYAASLVAFASGQARVGLGIIIGSNLYNLTIILGLVTFAAPGGRGIRLALREMWDARRVAWLAAAMGVTTWLSVRLFTSPAPWPVSFLPNAAPLVSLLTVGLFLGLLVHALQRLPHAVPPSLPHPSPQYVAPQPPPMSTLDAPPLSTSRLAPSAAPTIVACVFALALALAGVIVMVQAGQVAGRDVQLPPALLGLVVLAVATSLPNTVVAYQLARTDRAATCVEEILSSNGINLALGSALPALVWGIRVADPSLLRLDLPLLSVLGLAVVALVQARGIPRLVGTSLLGIYVLWVLAHILT
jgi:cation:H+ antiporter